MIKKCKKDLLTIFVIPALALFCFFPSNLFAANLYYNAAVDTSWDTPGNWWLDQDYTIPASATPLSGDDAYIDAGVDTGPASPITIHNLFVGQTYDAYLTLSEELTVTGTSTFDVSGSQTAGFLLAGTIIGNAVFYDDSSTNGGIIRGTAIFNDMSTGSVEGTAIFNEEGSEPITVTGTQIRRYSATTTTSRNFIGTGPWTVMADGAQVTLAADAQYNASTTFITRNGGSFVTNPSSVYFSGSTVTLTYPSVLDVNSSPSVNDFTVTRNGYPLSILSVAVVGSSVNLTLASTVPPSESLVVNYVPGISSIRTIFGINSVSLAGQVVNHIALPVGINPNYALAVGKKVYVANTSSGSVSVIDSSTDTVIATINVGNTPYHMTAIGNKVFVGNQNSGTVSVINTLTDTVAATVSVGIGPSFLAAIGNKVFVLNQTSNTVSVINATTNAVTSTISVGAKPVFATLVATKLFISNQNSNTVSVVDTNTNTVVATVPVQQSPYDLTAIGTKVYVANTSSNSMSVIDSTSNSVVATILTPHSPYYSTAMGSKLYVTSNGQDNVFVIDSITDTVIADVFVGSGTFDPITIGNRVYVPSSTDNKLSVIDTVTDTVISNVLIGRNPHYLTHIDSKVYVPNVEDSTVSIIDAASLPNPGLVAFTSTSANGTYAQGESINVTANFNELVQAGSAMTVRMNTGASVVLDQVSGTTITGTYIIAAGEYSPDLAVSSITSASVSDAFGNNRTSYALPSFPGDLIAENSNILRNIGDSKNISIRDTYSTIPTGTNPYQVSVPVVIGADSFIYVANQGSNSVSVVNTGSGAVIAAIPVGSEPYGVTVVTLGSTKYVYVANTGSNNVSVIDTTSNTVVSTITVGVKPYYVEHIGTNVYVTNSQSNSVSVIDANSNTVTATVYVGVYPRGIKAHGTDLYVANYGDETYPGGNYISVINSLNNTVSANIVMPAGSDGPRGITLSGDSVYVTNYRSHNVSVINALNNTVTATLSVGNGPRGVIVVGTYLYVENFDDGTISIIDISDNSLVKTLVAGHSPAGMSLVGTDIYVSGFQDNQLSILDTTTNTIKVSVSGIPVTAQTPTPVGGASGGSSGSYIPAVLAPAIQQASSSASFLGGLPPVLYSRYLTLGSRGADVLSLQKYLNTHGFSIAKSGIGSIGKETNFFGGLTKAALIRFQKSKKLYPAVGYFGPLTKAFVEKNK